MLFRSDHIRQIRTGSKTATRREWADEYPRPNVGAIHIASTEFFASDDDADCYIRIRDVSEQALGEMSDADARAEGDYAGVDEFRDAYEDIYGDGAWDSEKVVTVVGFEYVGPERPERQGSLGEFTQAGRAQRRVERIQHRGIAALAGGDDGR